MKDHSEGTKVLQSCISKPREMWLPIQTPSGPLSPLALATVLVWSSISSHESSVAMEAVSENADDSETVNRRFGKVPACGGWQDQGEQVAELEPQCSIPVRLPV